MTIRYKLNADGQVDLSIYDLSGQLVRVLQQGLRTAGTHKLVWDGNNAAGQSLASGVYLVRLRFGADTGTDTGTAVRKLTFLQ
jgi:flagellar hook assembly protein FlgD